MIRFYLHDKTPREKETYTVDWTPHLPSGAAIAGSLPTELTTVEGTVAVADGVNNTGTNETSFTISGGVVGEVAKVVVGVDLDDGSMLDATCFIGVR